MNDARAANRIICDARCYNDILWRPGGYIDELNNWAENEKSWDYAKIDGNVTWQQKQDGQTIFLLDIGADRLLQCVLDKELIFTEREHITIWGEITSGGYYYDGYGNEIECFNFYVHDYFIPRTQKDAEINKILNDESLWNDGPIDWNTIPEYCRNKWFGFESVFVSATSEEQRQITDDAFAGMKYELKKWYYYPATNTLYLGIIPEGCEEFYMDIHTALDKTFIFWDYTKVEICDAHIKVFTSDMDVNTSAILAQYQSNSEEYLKMSNFLAYFNGSLASVW